MNVMENFQYFYEEVKKFYFQQKQDGIMVASEIMQLMQIASNLNTSYYLEYIHKFQEENRPY